MRCVAAQLTALDLPGSAIRERLHLDPLTKAAFDARVRRPSAARTLRAAAFSAVGPVDVVLDAPPLLVELKWSYDKRDKIFESAWDAVKLVMVGPANGFDCLYLATGGSPAAWSRTEVRDLFEGGEVGPHDMWRRTLRPPGPNGGNSIASDLISGARGNRPSAMPERMVITPLLDEPASDYRLKVVRVAPEAGLVPYQPVVP